VNPEHPDIVIEQMFDRSDWLGSYGGHIRRRGWQEVSTVSATNLASVLSRTPGIRRASELAEQTADLATRPVIPVLPELAGLLPDGGLRRGSTVTVQGSTALVLALLAAATQQSWAAIVGMPDLGVLAAAELGVVTERLALVPHPSAQAAEVIAALLDGIGVVAVVTDQVLPAGNAGATLGRRLSTRARNRESVLIPVGSWPAADLQMRCTAIRWDGVGRGYGHLVGREIDVLVHGRGGAARPTHTTLRLPADRPPGTEWPDRCPAPPTPEPPAAPRTERPAWSTRLVEAG
jgi:hypothetical protein